MLCGEWVRVKAFADRMTVEPLKCKCWTCDYCQPYRAARLKREALSGRPDTFLTLTVNPKVGWSPEDRARRLVVAWRKVRQRAMRKYGYKSLPFMAVFEATKKGEPHLHILMRTPWLSQKWLSTQMASLLDSPIVDIRRIKAASQVAGYVAKYVGKQPHQFAGTKRYWRSRDYLIDPSKEEMDAREPDPITWIERVGIERFLHTVEYMGGKLLSTRRDVTTFTYLLARERGPPP